MAGPTADGSALRREDPPLVTGAAHYGDGLFPPGMLPGVFVRAPLAHGRIVGVDPSVAAGLPGVAGVFCATDLDLPPMPAGDGPAAMARPVLAADVVRFQGEGVAGVVGGGGAETRAGGVGGAGAVGVPPDPLPVVTDPEAALAADAPRLFPDGN